MEKQFNLKDTVHIFNPNTSATRNIEVGTIEVCYVNANHYKVRLDNGGVFVVKMVRSENLYPSKEAAILAGIAWFQEKISKEQHALDLWKQANA